MSVTVPSNSAAQASVAESASARANNRDAKRFMKNTPFKIRQDIRECLWTTSPQATGFDTFVDNRCGLCGYIAGIFRVETGGRTGPRTKETLTDEGTKRTTGEHPARNAVPQGSARRASSCFLTCTSRTWASLLRDERDCSGSIIAEAVVFTTRACDAGSVRRARVVPCM